MLQSRMRLCSMRLCISSWVGAVRATFYQISIDSVLSRSLSGCSCISCLASLRPFIDILPISCYRVMLCKRTVCWMCPLPSRKRSFLVYSGAEFFGEDLASCRNSSTSCGIGYICESPQQRLSQENSLRLAVRRRCSFCQITLTSCLLYDDGCEDQTSPSVPRGGV